MPVSGNATTPLPEYYKCPPFPSLYWLIGPPHVVQPAYIYGIRDAWRFTLFWTIIVFEAAHLLVAIYAVAMVWWGGREKRVKGGMGRKGRGKGKDKLGRILSRISGMWAVPVVYGMIAGIEALLAGSVVGLM